MKTPFHQNIRAGFAVFSIPLCFMVGLAWIVYVSSFPSSQPLVQANEIQSNPELPPTWKIAAEQFEKLNFTPERRFAYYKVRNWQTPQTIADHFSVPKKKLIELNPEPIVPGVTIKIPPVEAPLTELAPTELSPSAVRIIEENGIITVRGKDNLPLHVTTIPRLAAYLKAYGVLNEVAPRQWRLEKPLFLDTNIRLDVTKQTIDSLELKSEPNSIVCLCLENAQMLIKDVSIRSFDPAAGDVDKNPNDGRSYIRARRNSRLDILNSDISYLGNDIILSEKEVQQGGGTYGISWRIPDARFGSEIATGWVEGNKFHHNYYGSYTFGASGMVWKNNHYYNNDVYGLDPHDDSNNALVEYNVFEHNGKHGFVMSKRCNNNIIRHNLSFSNKLHGFMLHEDSQFNLVENNQAYDNVDNFVIFQ